jgi:hypothetical protein
MDNLSEGSFDVNSGAISPRDCAQLFEKCITADPKLRYAILHGSSEMAQPMMDIQHTKKLIGYAPQDGTAFVPPELRPKL